MNAPAEQWVDATTVANHLGFKSDHIRKLANAGKIPGRQMGNGARQMWRFKLSQVDQWMSGNGGNESVVA